MTFSPYSNVSRMEWTATDNGLIAWSYDPVPANSTHALTAGVLSLNTVLLRTETVINNVIADVITAGATLTAGENFAGLYNSQGVLLAATSDQSASWTTGGVKTMPLSSPQPVGPGMYWVALLANGTTTPAFLVGSGYPGAANVGLSASSLRGATNGTGLTSLPASITPSANIASPPAWVALS